MLAHSLPRSWSAALRQLERDLRTVGRRVAGHHPSPLVKGFARGEAPPKAEIRGRAEARELVVARVIRETLEAVTLVLRAPDGAAFAFRPGQFFTLLTEIDGELVPRNYSASNVPGEAELHLTIKTKAGGRVSPVLARTRSGDRVRVLGPFGSFVVPEAASLPARRRLVLVAGGAGITPLASIARTILATEPDSEIALVYANRREEDIILAGELESLVVQHGARFTLLHVLEEPPARWDGEVGRLDRRTAARALDALPLAVHQDTSLFFVCGPDPMRDEVLAALAARGVADDAIRIERFLIGPRPQVATSSAAIAAAVAPGARPIAIRVKDRTHRTIALPGATVLEAGLAAGADMPFSCGVGGCGACRVKLVEGSVELEEPNCLSDAERAAGYVLACVGRPCGPCTGKFPDALTEALMFGAKNKKLTSLLPLRMQNQMDGWFEALQVLMEVRDPRVLASLAPSGIRGLVLQRGKQGVPTKTRATHSAHFDWSYPSDNPEMRALYTRAKTGQWNSDTTLAWSTSVDPYDPATPLLPEGFLDFDALSRMGIKLDAKERARLVHSVASWMLSQFLHGEQGALFAAAQVTEAVEFFDGKLYGATQVMDEGRHVEVFHRYLDTKLEKLYQVNDNLFVIIDALMADSRWDMKFLGMQIMVEGLALGAFGTLYKQTKEPLLKNLLKYVIQDEARHVHYGVLALRDHMKVLSESERREREDWSFEVALLMRNRFLAYEVYEEWFEGVLPRAQWREFVTHTPGMHQFRQTMFSRLVPNLREIGLITPRLLPRYEKVGLLQYMGGLSADRLDGDGLLAELDRAA